jgi:hypothetical protein
MKTLLLSALLAASLGAAAADPFDPLDQGPRAPEPLRPGIDSLWPGGVDPRSVAEAAARFGRAHPGMSGDSLLESLVAVYDDGWWSSYLDGRGKKLGALETGSGGYYSAGFKKRISINDSIRESLRVSEK